LSLQIVARSGRTFFIGAAPADTRSVAFDRSAAYKLGPALAMHQFIKRLSRPGHAA
jgi:hypothetical protein